ncbi:GTP-binding protein HflX [Enterococcus haemoperoxidus ATCC BAA-382]|uniref:GTPase HflX n=1 Tax=Enterococcus haemoperoxidus ATCC BAA-382 TaxID=1158608 RepID=R2Q8C9_9ENTE|nr:GTPase HflX [Enterococcus haemoperoxidus]EOH92757.1 GTP-binding protein HflX [Enterococcus haemoperoxidus ATCC BAA-382]EOT61500.1 GTP-binding protein HflX [Enterococcus haemoperoxidus ATCC BAA-382]OJG55333.1 GTP-binding protein HflX [Enterococcus haemoperoxidus]
MDKIAEKVILVGVETEGNYTRFEGSMKELKNLTKTAQGEVVFSLTQKRPRIDSQTVIGKGKVEELMQLVDAYEADIVIFNHELTPRQNQLIVEAVGVKVIDRVQLILDIFAMRARSKEGKLQVELAQLNYLLPRLVGQGKQLSRLGGGIGTRGPGETKLESDRRHIRDKIIAIKRELKEVSAHRERSRQKRQSSDLFQIGLLGYTNAGKSTILNLLTTAGTYSENQLFATLDPLTKKWQLPQGMIVTLTDTVGFIQDLPTQLIEAFQSTLEESRGMDLLLHVVDASAEDRLQHEQTVVDLLNDLDLEKIPVLTVYNKSDQVDEADFVPTLFPNILVSARSTLGKEELTKAVREKMMELLVPYELDIPSNQGQQLSELKRHTLLLSETFEEEENVYHVKGFAKKDSKWTRELDE